MEIPKDNPNQEAPKTLSLKKKILFVIVAFFLIAGSLWLGGQLRTFALPAPYNPGDTLDPDCAPGSSAHCTVQILPPQAGNAGKFLQTDGTTTSWVNETGGLFDGSQTITRSGIGGTGTVVGLADGTLKDFIQAYFFPAVAPSATLTGGSTVEWGASPSFSLTYSVTRHTNPVTAISLSGSTISPCLSGGSCPEGADIGTGPITVAVGTSIDATGVDGGVQSHSRNATTPANTDTTFSISVTPTATGSSSTTRAYLPRVYYGIATSNLMDATAFPDTGGSSALNVAIRTLASNPLQNSRVIPVTAFTGSSVYIYFAWPTYHAPTSAFSNYEPSAGCQSLDYSTFIAGSGTVACFNSGGTAGSLFPLNDMIHRTVAGFRNVSGANISYELYRTHFALSSSGSTVYYQIH